jgi:hypothetical protein
MNTAYNVPIVLINPSVKNGVHGLIIYIFEVFLQGSGLPPAKIMNKGY